jgi:hypothetical protein
LKDVVLVNKAVLNQEGPITLFYNKDTPGHPCMSTLEGRKKIVRDQEVIEGTRLSHYIDGKIDLLKLDIEGAELSVIIDLEKQKKLDQINKMIIEYHHHLSTQKDELARFLAILEKHNFGYQLGCEDLNGTKKFGFQDILVYAYKKE